jgi:hypothetical protein
MGWEGQTAPEAVAGSLPARCPPNNSRKGEKSCLFFFCVRHALEGPSDHAAERFPPRPLIVPPALGVLHADFVAGYRTCHRRNGRCYGYGGIEVFRNFLREQAGYLLALLRLELGSERPCEPFLSLAVNGDEDDVVESGCQAFGDVSEFVCRRSGDGDLECDSYVVPFEMAVRSSASVPWPMAQNAGHAPQVLLHGQRRARAPALGVAVEPTRASLRREA